MFANAVAMAEREVAALAGEGFVERIGAQDGARRDFVFVAQGREALQIDIGFQPVGAAQTDVAFDDAVLADNALGTNFGVRMDAGGGRHLRRRIDGHASL